MEDPLATIDTDLPCAICGYNLKGLSPDSNCPECGQGIERTLEANRDFGHSNPQWLRRQAVTMLLLAVIAWLNGNLSNSWGVPSAVNYCFTALLLIVLIVAVFRLSAPELPYATPHGHFDAWRRGTRAAAVILIGSDVIYFLPFTTDYRLLGLLGLTHLVAVAALDWLVGTYLYRFARRAGETSLIFHARLMLWALPTQYLLQFGMIFLDGRASTYGPNPVTYYGKGIIACLGTVVVYAYVLLLGRLHQVLSATARDLERSQPPLPTS